MNVRAEFERNRFVLTVDGTGFSVLNIQTEMFTTLGLWLRSYKRPRSTSLGVVTRIAIFVSLSILHPQAWLLMCCRVPSSSVHARWLKVVSNFRNVILPPVPNLDSVQGT